MLRLALLVVVIGQAILWTCAVRIPISQFKTHLHREPPISEAKTPRVPRLEYIEQRVDNFDPNNEATFQMV